VDIEKARAYFKRRQGALVISPLRVNMLVDDLLRKFLLEGRFDVK
jgi:hypothetical protein